MQKRPIGVTILAILALLAALAAAWHTLQMLHLAPINMGQMHFYTFDLLGALLWGLMVVIYVVVFRWLWTVSPQGWMFVTIIAVLNLILDFLSILGSSSWSALWPSILVNAIILIYALLPGTKAAFQIPQSPARK